jgi:spore coat polysaccharide biosynthesis predicted glycosyltransferase SpsG
MTVRVGMRCDAGERTGVGHLMRCVALAEEFLAQGHEVVFLVDVGGLAWAARQLAGRGLTALPPLGTPAGLAAETRQLGLDVVVTDSYDLTPAYGEELRRAGIRVVAIVDGDPLGQVADVYVDQNLDAELQTVRLPEGALRLAGLSYVLIRDSVLAQRPLTAPVALERGPAEPVRVLGFFGGTDAFGAAPVLAELLVATGLPVAATIVAGSPATRSALAGVRAEKGQAIEVIGPTDELPGLIVGADLVITAAGTSTWEVMCLGAPAALVWVADNQRLGFERAVAHGYAYGLGHVTEVAGAGRENALRALRELLTEPARRTGLSDRGWRAVDGRGRQRVIEAILSVPFKDQ